MITEQQKAANVFRGMTARACEHCVRKRARWYCAADDAFLCHGCDSVVHSANQLAGRHERVRIESASSSSKVTTALTLAESDHRQHKKPGVAQAWYNGFTRKARTPRPNKTQQLAHKSISSLPVVPDLGFEEQGASYESEEQLLYRVPVFDPFEAAEICNLYNNEDQEISDEGRLLILDTKREASLDGATADDDDNMISALDNFSEFLPSDVDLAEFAADVETLLTKTQADADGVEDVHNQKHGVDGKGEAICIASSRSNAKVIKLEEDDDEGETLLDSNLELMLDMRSCENMNCWNLDYESLVDMNGEAAAEDCKLSLTQTVGAHDCNEQSDQCNDVSKKKSIFLRLNYEEVISAWASQCQGSSPWTTGHRPQLSPYSGWPDCWGSSSDLHSCGGVESNLRGMSTMRGGEAGGGREARVSRYREKRRTRLFAKKIRYEVRKLNAESRPRMKGRFVKRTSFIQTAPAAPATYI